MTADMTTTLQRSVLLERALVAPMPEYDTDDPEGAFAAVSGRIATVTLALDDWSLDAHLAARARRVLEKLYALQDALHARAQQGRAR